MFIYIYTALIRTPIVDCYRARAVPKILFFWGGYCCNSIPWPGNGQSHLTLLEFPYSVIVYYAV